jgi:uncharacterized protein (TIGR03435 family)
MRAFFKIILGICAACFPLHVASARASEDSPGVGDIPPPLKLSKMVQGPAIENVGWDKLMGKVVVLEFWNTLCAPCIQAIPHLNELVEQFSGRQVIFLSVSDDNPDHLKRFLERKPIKGWLALDGLFKATASAFGVTGNPHTVIVDSAGRVAAITHPALLKAQHLEEILAGKPCTLPANFVPNADAPVVAVTSSLPSTVEITIEGPFPQPEGAFGSRGWKGGGCVFQARKAPLFEALAEFFQVSPKLIFEHSKLPEGLYDISAAAPPDQTPELRRRFIEAVRAKWGITIETTTREVSVYVISVCSTNAPGLKPVQKRAGGGEVPGGFFLGGSAMSSIASLLELSLDKPVVDESGLQGLWAADVRWEMSESELSLGSEPEADKVIKAAREQLGLELRLTLRRMPVLEIRTSN